MSKELSVPLAACMVGLVLRCSFDDSTPSIRSCCWPSPFTAEKMGNLRHSPVLARVRWWVHESGDSFPVPLFLFPPRMTHFSEYPTGDSSVSACKSKAV